MVGKKKLCIVTLVLLITLSSLGAAENPIVTMNLLPTLSYKVHSDLWETAFNGDLSVALSSKREGNVRGEVVLKANTLIPPKKLDDVLYKAYFKARFPSFRLTAGKTRLPWGDGVLFNAGDVLYKAYFRARFPSFRLTAGKTRLSWGDGMLFNAGDVLYGSNSTSVSLTQTELRSTTSWLASVNYPLGFFSFAEVVLMPSEATKPSDTFFGVRFYTIIKDIKVEGGYATMQESGERLHKPYLSLQGNLGFAWYLSTSVALPTTGDSWMISGGLFHLVELALDRSLTLRLEFLSRPFGSWEAGPVSDSSATLLLYPELVFAYSPSLSFNLRSIISPLDLSAMSTLGVSWNIFEAFNLIGSLSLATSDDGDLFAWSPTNPGKPASFSATVGSSWIF